MLKKLRTIATLGVLCLCIAGCSNASDKEKSTKLDTNLPEAETETEAKVQEIILDNAFLSKIQESTSKFTYLNSSQKMTSYSLLNNKKENEREIANVSIKADTKNQIILTTMTTSKTVEDKTTYSFADDITNDIHISKIDDGEYIASDELNATLGVDYSKISNVYDYIVAICNNNLPMNVVGAKDNNTYTFTLERKAVETDLTGTKYDKLGTTTIVFTVSEDEDKNLTPESISMDTTFFIGQIEYGVSTTCSFSGYSTNEITFPEYKTTGD